MRKEEIIQLIIRNTCEVIPELDEYNFRPEDEFKELGANSVDRAEIISMTLESLSLDIPRVEMYGAENIGDLAALIYEKYRKA